MKIIGKININKIKKYKNVIITKEVILTKEREIHIYNNHQRDYKEIMKHMKKAITRPNEIIEDLKNEDTLLFIKKLNKNNLNVIIKLNTTNNKKCKKNSVMTAWIIRDKNLLKIEKKNKIIYKKE